MLAGEKIVLGITGGISAYKAVDLASKLTQAGAQVNVVMTKAATEFVTPLSFRSVTHRPVLTELFDPASEFSVEHVALAEWAELVAIVPATANTIAKLAAGIADELLSCTVLATKAPVLLAPAMNVQMYENSVTQENLAKLRARGFVVVGPVYGRLASGAVGMGRLAEIDDILGTIRQVLGREGELAGKRVVVSAGGTQEPIDLVRHIANRSSGKMGYALAEAARDRGASVVLVSAPTWLSAPVGVDVIQVRTVVQMRDAVIREAGQADVLIMAAAVADYSPVTSVAHKIKRRTTDTMTIELARTPDILAEVRGELLKVGFAAESENLIENAKEELERKGLDLVVANDITDPDSGFAVDTNRVVLVDRYNEVESLPLMLKSEVAERVLDKVVALLQKRG